MKGFLSFSGITVISAACGAILLSFYGNPMEDFKSQEREMAYQEMRANHADIQMASNQFAENGDYIFEIESGESCPRVAFEQ